MENNINTIMYLCSLGNIYIIPFWLTQLLCSVFLREVEAKQLIEVDEVFIWYVNLFTGV